MLIITPRTFFIGAPTSGGRLLGGRGIIAGASSRNGSIVGMGSRPWLQKVAALTVAVSLIIATVDTFRVAERQYNTGLLNAAAMRNEVVGGMEIRIIRVISDIFLWLAQVQTLIRLFPRHKEKVLIKWIGFALIVFDTVFSCLNSFLVDSTDKPREFVNAIPALSYLFQLALELLYGAWVLFYVATKRRYAWYHPKMRNISLVALLSLLAVLTPVVFFVTDIAQPDVDGWGDYFRWVGAAAASVLVWEWVERIESLEREEKKDGILGREIFDGDEMLDVTPSSEVKWPGQGHDFGSDEPSGQDSKASKPYASGTRSHGLTRIAQRIAGARLHLRQQQPDGSQHPQSNSSNRPLIIPRHGNPDDIRPPTAVASPAISTDATSAISTVYAVQYHTSDSPSPFARFGTPRPTGVEKDRGQIAIEKTAEDQSREQNSRGGTDAAAIRRGASMRWQAIANSFKRRRDTPPLEVRQAMANSNSGPAQISTNSNASRWDVMSRLASLAVDSTERWRDKGGKRQADIELPVTIIPAQPRGRTWSPGSLPLNDPISKPNSAFNPSTSSDTGQDMHMSRGAPSSPMQPRGGSNSPAVSSVGMSPLAQHTATENDVLRGEADPGTESGFPLRR
ncbi:MAG: hypothetical protein Q9165_007099 [Trypethelium subeluteriae]